MFIEGVSLLVYHSIFWKFLIIGDSSNQYKFKLNLDSHFSSSFFYSRQFWDEFSVVKCSRLSGLSLPIFDWSVIALNRPKETFQGCRIRGVGVEPYPPPPPDFGDQLTLSQPGADYAHHITTGPPDHQIFLRSCVLSAPISIRRYSPKSTIGAKIILESHLNFHKLLVP